MCTVWFIYVINNVSASFQHLFSDVWRTWGKQFQNQGCWKSILSFEECHHLEVFFQNMNTHEHNRTWLWPKLIKNPSWASQQTATPTVCNKETRWIKHIKRAERRSDGFKKPVKRNKQQKEMVFTFQAQSQHLLLYSFYTHYYIQKW